MAEDRLDGMMFRQDRKQYGRIREEARSFRAQCGGLPLRDDIFSVIKNFAEKNHKALELFRFPIRDERLRAFSVVREGVVFCVINTALPLETQIFAAAYELFFIRRFIEGRLPSFSDNGSIYLKGCGDQQAQTFAALVLALDSEIADRMELYDMDRAQMRVRDIVRLADCFGLSYTAMTLRLYEGGFLEKNRAGSFLEREWEARQYMEDSGVCRRWTVRTEEVCFGELPVMLRENEDSGDADGAWKCRERLEEIVSALRK